MPSTTLVIALALAGLLLLAVWRAVVYLDPDDSLLDILGPPDEPEEP